MAVRLSMVAVCFFAVIAAFGIPRTPLALLGIPAAVLTGLAFSAPIMAYAATRKTAGSFNALFRFVITPLFLFSDVFFPVTRLPEALQTFAWFTPLFHGAALVRALVLNTLESTSWIIHVAYLCVMLAIGAAASVWTFQARLRA
jgi:lipooligosaccharide transport system permease protein